MNQLSSDILSCTFATMNSNLENDKARRWVSAWIITGVVMLLIQVVLGGITRLTGSGLSITEWNVVTGALPPLNEQHWITEFEKYKQTPQYRLLNTAFTLSDFKFIFFLGMVSPLLGKVDRCGFSGGICVPGSKTIPETGHAKAIIDPVFVRCITGSDWLDYGSKRIDRGCGVC